MVRKEFLNGIFAGRPAILHLLAYANSQLEQRVIERTGEIRAAEQRFKVTFENAAVGMGIIDPAGNLVSVNDSLACMLGTTRTNL